MKTCFFLFAIFIMACNNKNKLYEEKESGETEYKTNDTIPEVRREVKKMPVASYLVPSKKKFINYKLELKCLRRQRLFNTC
jgi:hypothetical protein